MGGRQLRLRSIEWSGPELAIEWSIDERAFTTTLVYDTVDWNVLTSTVGLDAVRCLAFHIAMFEINKGVSFAPAQLVVAPEWSGLVTPELVALWQTVVDKAWAQWRYDHDRPDYAGPSIEGVASTSRGPAGAVASRGKALWFCGGGKDSLLTSHLLTSAGASYDALAYTHSVYGEAEHQVQLLDNVIAASDASATHRIAMFDSAMASAPAYSDTRYVLAAETPASVFAALPIAVAHGYDRLVVGHERSANVGNLHWSATGEEINHQWGKSFAAERLLHDYVRDHVVSGVEYFSALQPIGDPLVFASLRSLGERVNLAHSCNVTKPWCLRCPKCAYVWISYAAWLPADVLRTVFGPVNPLDLTENRPHYRQMLGLEEHTPFECIGQVDEVRLAFALARARGVTGAAMRYLDELGPFDVEGALAAGLAIEHGEHLIPDDLFPLLLAEYERASLAGRAFASAALTSANALSG